MVNGFWTIYYRRLNKWFSFKFSVGSQVRQETPEEGRKTYQPKHCENKNEDEENSPNIQRDKTSINFFLQSYNKLCLTTNGIFHKNCLNSIYTIEIF